MLPKPLYRYESTDPSVLDGALFSFVTSAGADPEALLDLAKRHVSRRVIVTRYRCTTLFCSIHRP